MCDVLLYLDTWNYIDVRCMLILYLMNDILSLFSLLNQSQCEIYIDFLSHEWCFILFSPLIESNLILYFL